MLELCFLLQLCVVYALPSFIAQATSSSPAAVLPPSPTPPPSFHHDLLRRAEASRLCGWVDGKSESAYYCNQTDATCLWNNEKKTVGCGDSASMSSVTSCYDFGSSRNCDDKCRANPENLFCPSSAPYCNIVAFPDSFSRILDCSNNITQQVTVALTYENFRTKIHLPRSIVSGVVAAATQTPTVPKSTETGVNKGSIIAASVGGAVLLLGLPFGIKMFWRRRQWSKAQRPRRLQEREMRRQWAEPSNPYSRSAIPDPPPPAAGQNFLFSQDWHGQSKTARTGATNYEMQGNG